jgi:hypothetical protein
VEKNKKGYYVREKLRVCENCRYLCFGSFGEHDFCQLDNEEICSTGTCKKFMKKEMFVYNGTKGE